MKVISLRKTILGTLCFVVAFLCLSTVAEAGRSDYDSVKIREIRDEYRNRMELRQLQEQIDAIKAAIEDIELTPGPQGSKGDKGDKGESIQGPQGEPGTSSWSDGFETVSTTGSVQIGNDTSECTAANAGTIRFNNGTFEGCDGTAWVPLSSSAPQPFVCGRDQVQDADGNLYDTVQIGTQCWMAENLNVGTMVSESTDMTNNTVIEKYCYGNDPNICMSDGVLYQWGEVMKYSTEQGAQGICPDGWHVPTEAEWRLLTTPEEIQKLHLTLGGYRQLEPPFTVAMGVFGVYWSSTLENTERARYGAIAPSRQYINWGHAYHNFGLSVRCLKDEQ